VNRFTIGIVLVAAVASSGCTLAKLSGAGPRPLLLNNPANGKFEVVRHFEIDKGSRFDFTNTAEIDAMVATLIQETKADAVINLRVTVKTEVGDFFLNLITCGIANARTWTIEGDAIRYN
jgi:hypothetical protein